jgi:hypothetical protein
MVDFDTESLTLFVNFVAGGGASRTTFPGGTWERVTSRLEGILQEGGVWVRSQWMKSKTEC